MYRVSGRPRIAVFWRHWLEVLVPDWLTGLKHPYPHRSTRRFADPVLIAGQDWPRNSQDNYDRYSTRHNGSTRFNPSDRVLIFSAESTEAISALPRGATHSTRLNRMNVWQLDHQLLLSSSLSYFFIVLYLTILSWLKLTGTVLRRILSWLDSIWQAEGRTCWQPCTVLTFTADYAGAIQTNSLPKADAQTVTIAFSTHCCWVL